MPRTIGIQLAFIDVPSRAHPLAVASASVVNPVPFQRGVVRVAQQPHLPNPPNVLPSGLLHRQMLECSHRFGEARLIIMHTHAGGLAVRKLAVINSVASLVGHHVPPATVDAITVAVALWRWCIDLGRPLCILLGTLQRGQLQRGLASDTKASWGLRLPMLCVKSSVYTKSGTVDLL